MAVTKNEYLSVLEDKTQQDDVYQAVQTKTDWLSLFNNTRVQIHAFGARYLIDMPKPGKDWKPDLHPLNPASGFIRKIPLAFVDIPAIIDKVYSELIPEDRLQEALADDRRVNELTTQLKGNVAIQMITDVKDALRKIWTTDANYWEATWNDGEKRWDEDGNLFHYHPNYFKDPDWILKQVLDTGDEFLEPNTRFQKGFFFDGPVDETEAAQKDRNTKTHWNKVQTNTIDLKHIFIIFNNPVLNTIKVGKYAMAPSPSYVNLEDYGKIIKTKLPNNFQMIMQDHRVSVLRPRDQNQGFYHEFEAANQTHWFHLPSKVYGGMITCLNNCAWKTSTTKGRKEDPGAKPPL